MKKLELHWQILIAIVLAGFSGWLVNRAIVSGTEDPSFLGVGYIAAFDYIGTIFLNALKMIIVPLIMSSIIIGVAGIGSGGNLGALGGKTLLFYAATTLAAIVVGLSLVHIVGPGFVDGEPAGDMLALEDTGEIEAAVAGKGPGDVAKVFQRMVPANVVQAAAEGQMLGIIFFAILFGYFMTHLTHDLAEPLFRFWDGVFHVMMRMTEWIMKFAPIGVYGLVASVVAKTMERVEENVGVSNKISSFVLPLGATVNMNGTALYECAAAIFLAQAYGLDLTFGVQFSIVVIALLTSIGVAGVPSASLVAIAIILGAVGLPVEAIGVLLVFDRLLDMARTAINVFGDACCAVIVARLSGEETNLAPQKAGSEGTLEADTTT